MPVALIASMCCACRMAVVILVVKQCIFSHLSPGVYCSAWLLSMSHDFNRPALFFPSTFILDVQFQAITVFFFFSFFHVSILKCSKCFYCGKLGHIQSRCFKHLSDLQFNAGPSKRLKADRPGPNLKPPL